VPVTSLEDWVSSLEKLLDQFVERWNNFIALRHRQRTSGAKIVLHVNND
jgi:hypothetical protein